MLIDAPSYDDSKSNNNLNDELELTEDNADEILAVVMGMVQ